MPLKGLALVGEAGPELVNFKGGERVLNARNTQRALEGATSGNAGNTFNVTFNNLQGYKCLCNDVAVKTIQQTWL